MQGDEIANIKSLMIEIKKNYNIHINSEAHDDWYILLNSGH